MCCELAAPIVAVCRVERYEDLDKDPKNSRGEARFPLHCGLKTCLDARVVIGERAFDLTEIAAVNEEVDERLEPILELPVDRSQPGLDVREQGA